MNHHEDPELSQQTQETDDGRFSRRTLIGGAAGLGLAAPALGALLGALPAGAAAAQASTVKVIPNRANLNFVVVTHGQPSDPFWSVVEHGVTQGGKDMGVKVQYESPTSNTLDLVAMARLIDAATATKPDGLVVSIPDASAIGPSVKKAVAAGIPVISINSGADVAASLGVLIHVGQTEYEAGLGGGERLAKAGVKNNICVNQEVGNVALDQRCKGVGDALAKTGAKSKVVGVQLSDPTGSQQRIQAALTADPSIDGIMTLGPTGASPALKALQTLHLTDKVKLATFDLSPDVLTAIDDGTILFAIDQQQYLQGYLPIVLLTLYRTNLNTVANPVLMTGPGFVTKENAAAVIQLAKAGTR